MGIHPACGRPMPCTLAQPSPAPLATLVMLWLPPLLSLLPCQSTAATVPWKSSIEEQLTD